MLVIRRSQAEALASHAFGQFLARLEPEIRRIWRAECQHFGEDQVSTLVERVARRALELGFRIERDVARFVHLAWALEDSDFEHLPWVAERLAGTDAAPRARLDAVWAEARRRLESRKDTP